ncbi:MAG: phosphoribosylanthranilate isomerase [Candidatus Thermoplasmatota archaeon]|nr:phosphoribosylanthranilate isomerase [Candidatus Thermoplasmatota archaeon]
MKVKICGITNLSDAAMCEELGADMLGFVHVDGRARSVSSESISEIGSCLGQDLTKILVCYPQSASHAIDLGRRSEVDAIQSHTLSPEDLVDIRDAGFMVIRAVKTDRSTALPFSEAADALLFENGIPGSGSAYDYSSVPMDCHPRTIIAGGLKPSNVHLAKAMNPYAVDVSSGVERSIGVKDRGLLSEFIRRCRE